MRVLSSIMVVAMLMLTLSVSAQGPGAGRGAGRGRGPAAGMRDMPTSKIVEMMSKRLDLTDEQKTKATEIIESTRAQLKDNVGDVRSCLEKSREAIAGILTPEQKEKMAKLKGGMMEAAGSFAQAHGQEIKQGMQQAGEEIRLRMALNTLTLTDEQKTKLKEAGDKFNEQRKAIMSEVQPKLDALRTETKTAIDSILTPEQKTQLEQRVKDMPKPGAEGRGFQGGPRGEGKGAGKADRQAEQKPGPANSL